MMAMIGPLGRAFEQLRFQYVADGGRLLQQIVDGRQIACATEDLIGEQVLCFTPNERAVQSQGRTCDERISECDREWCRNFAYLKNFVARLAKQFPDGDEM